MTSNNDVDTIKKMVVEKTPKQMVKPFNASLTIVGKPSMELSLGVKSLLPATNADLKGPWDDKPLSFSNC